MICAGSTAFAQEIWEDFDNPANVSYFFHDGTSFNESFANPNTSGVNSSALCGEYARNGGVLFDVIVMDPAGALLVDDVADYVSGSKTMSIKLYSPAAGIPVQITLEDRHVALPGNYPTGRHS